MRSTSFVDQGCEGHNTCSVCVCVCARAQACACDYRKVGTVEEVFAARGVDIRSDGGLSMCPHRIIGAGW